MTFSIGCRARTSALRWANVSPGNFNSFESSPNRTLMSLLVLAVQGNGMITSLSTRFDRLSQRCTTSSPNLYHIRIRRSFAEVDINLMIVTNDVQSVHASQSSWYHLWRLCNHELVDTSFASIGSADTTLELICHCNHDTSTCFYRWAAAASVC